MAASKASANLSATLASFSSRLTFESLPASTVSRTEDLFADWVFCGIAGADYRPLVGFEKFARAQGGSGNIDIIRDNKQGLSPYWAAFLNGGAGHVVEQDDVHNSSVSHPATVVFPAAWAATLALGKSGKDFITAAVAGYEVNCRLGELLGKSHYKVFHTTGTVGTLGAAAAVANLLKLGPEATLDAFGNAGTQAAGLWQFLADAADSKQLHCAHAAATGLQSAYLAAEGVKGAKDIFLGKQGMAAGMTRDPDPNPNALIEKLGKVWKMEESSFKWHASCRHTHPSADALLELMVENNLQPNDIESVVAGVHGAAIDVLAPAERAETVHQSKFSMGFVLSVIANKKQAHLTDFTDEALGDAELREFQKKVSMELDPEVDGAYPEQWLGKVRVTLKNGQTLNKKILTPKGDPGNSLSRDEIRQKAERLLGYAHARGYKNLDNQGASKVLDRLFRLQEEKDIKGLLVV